MGVPVNKADRKRLNRVAELGCIICRRLGFPGTPALIHHPRAGMGISQRAPHSEAIALCHAHHVGPESVHMLGAKGKFEATFGFSEADLVAETKQLLGEAQ